MNERIATILLARWAEPHLAFPNVHFLGWEMDVAVVTRSRLLWEIEVKLDMADWRADQHKAKWLSPRRRQVARMFYAVLPEMAELIPQFVPERTGVLVLHDGLVLCRRPARLRAAPPVSDEQLRTLLESTHHRFWRERRHRLIHGRRQARAAA